MRKTARKKKTAWEWIKDFVEDFRVWDRRSRRARDSLSPAA